MFAPGSVYRCATRAFHASASSAHENERNALWQCTSQDPIKHSGSSIVVRFGISSHKTETERAILQGGVLWMAKCVTPFICGSDCGELGQV